MENNILIRTLENLNKEASLYAIKKMRYKKLMLVALVVTLLFLLIFLSFLIAFLLNKENRTFMILLIIFLVLTLLALELAIIFRIFSKFVYEYKEKNRLKIIRIITNEIISKNNNNKSSSINT